MDKFQLKIAEELFKTLKSPKEQEVLIRKCYEECALPYNYKSGVFIPQHQAAVIFTMIRDSDANIPTYMKATAWKYSQG
jgi:hypothetical protein